MFVIVLGYGTEEFIEFCVDFVSDLKPIGLPQSRHEGRLSGKGTLEKKPMICRDGHSFTQAHYTVLQNSILVAPYIEKHKNIVRPITRGSLTPGLHSITCRLSAVGCKHIS